MTQTDLAKRSSLSNQSITYIMARGSCSIRSAGKLANALGVGVEEICIM
jgi:DNA-binding XRE family transcriptional regulator